MVTPSPEGAKGGSGDLNRGTTIRATAVGEGC